MRYVVFLKYFSLLPFLELQTFTPPFTVFVRTYLMHAVFCRKTCDIPPQMDLPLDPHLNPILLLKITRNIRLDKRKDFESFSSDKIFSLSAKI